MTKILSTLLLLILVSSFGFSQNKASKELRSIYAKHLHYGAILHTHGWGIQARHIKNITFDKRRILDFTYSLTLKHPREQVVIGQQQGSRPYIFGKLNQVGVMRFHYGRQKILADFTNPLSIRVNLNYMVGPGLALIKPVYLQVQFDDNILTEQFDADRHQDPNNILGSAGWSKGVSEMNILPGVSGKLALSFEWGKQEDRYRSFEVGAMVDIFPSNLPIMAYTSNQSLFVNVFASFSPWGKRW